MYVTYRNLLATNVMRIIFLFNGKAKLYKLLDFDVPKSDFNNINCLFPLILLLFLITNSGNRFI
jgi:hypothetical protein